MAANFIASNVPATFGEAVDGFKCVPFLPAFSCEAEVCGNFFASILTWFFVGGADVGQGTGFCGEANRA
jgi:hypothetical protein